MSSRLVRDLVWTRAGKYAGDTKSLFAGAVPEAHSGSLKVDSSPTTHALRREIKRMQRASEEFSPAEACHDC
jgi:hypothetical protein